jgi:hypothetical protein
VNSVAPNPDKPETRNPTPAVPRIVINSTKFVNDLDGLYWATPPLLRHIFSLVYSSTQGKSLHLPLRRQGLTPMRGPPDRNNTEHRMFEMDLSDYLLGLRFKARPIRKKGGQGWTDFSQRLIWLHHGGGTPKSVARRSADSKPYSWRIKKTMAGPTPEKKSPSPASQIG